MQARTAALTRSSWATWVMRVHATVRAGNFSSLRHGVPKWALPETVSDAHGGLNRQALLRSIAALAASLTTDALRMSNR